MIEDLHNKPEGWLKKPLGEVAKKITKGSTPTTYGYKFLPSGVNFIKIENVKNGKINLASITEFISEEAHNKQARSSLYPDDILFSIADTIGETAIVESKHLPANTNQAFAIISGTSNILSPKFLEYQLKSFVSQSIKNLARGGAMNNVSLEDLKELNITIAPLNEQKRIVAKIEELFSELDKGIENLKIAREQLKVYRQVVLKHAFEGKLTAHWREQNKDKLETADQLIERIKQEREANYQQQLKEYNTAVKTWETNGKKDKKPVLPAKPSEIVPVSKTKLINLPVLPFGWTYVHVSNLCEVVRGGSPRPAGDLRYYDGNIPFLKVADITRNPGAYLDSYTYTIKEAGLTKTRLISPKILLLSNSGATLGVPKICLIKTAFNDGIAAFLGLAEESLLYHYYFWLSKTRELRAIDQGAAQPNLNTDLLKEISIPICLVEEMQLVSQQIEVKLSVCDRLENEIEVHLQKSEALRQSILKRAFSGKLVAQDPNDEPASVLLERIRAEKETQKTESQRPKAGNPNIKQLDLIQIW